MTPSMRALALPLGLLVLHACPASAQTRPVVPAPPPATTGAPPRPDLDALAASFDHEPTVAEVLREALTLHDAGSTDPSRAARRARRSALLPELRVRARRGRERDASETQTGTNLSTDDDAVLEGTLVFQLPRAVYSGDEAAWSREARAQAAARVQVVRLVVGLYFERRRLQLEQALGDVSVSSVVRIAELEALLDGLTGGRFGELLRASREPESP
ncbi:MAG: hypothetical protein IPL19_23810 [Sandaracinaceae bacterium]|nr:hypothetical protein [Sandaracinaceae bacterium]MBK8410975.1 hypothetical protein [Sandaracinaceae bacterium]